MKKLIMKIFIMTLVFSIAVPIVSASTIPMLTDEVFEKTWFTESYNDYLHEKYGANYTEILELNANSVEKAVKIESLFSVDKNNEKIYPDFVGGLYINENHQLVIQLVEKTVPSAKKTEYSLYTKMLTVDSNVNIEYVKYAYAELNAVYNTIVEYATKNEKNNFQTFYVDSIHNTVVVGLKEFSKEEITKFKNTVINSPLILFEHGDAEYSAVKKVGSPVSLRGGCSIGYRAKTSANNETGFVTAGHCVAAAGTVYTGTGTVGKRILSGPVDGSYISTSAISVVDKPTNSWHLYSGSTVPSGSLSTTVTTSFFSGQIIGSIGQTSKHRTGTVQSTNWGANMTDPLTGKTVTMSGMVSTTAKEAAGDSGGIVYYQPIPTTTFQTAGIASIAENSKLVFSRADKINPLLLVSRY